MPLTALARGSRSLHAKLLISIAVLAGCILIEGAVDAPNRTAGLLSLGIAASVTLALGLAGRRRTGVIQFSLAVGCVASLVGFSLVDPTTLKEPWQSLMSPRWPFVSSEFGEMLSTRLALFGRVEPSTVGFMSLPVAIGSFAFAVGQRARASMAWTVLSIVAMTPIVASGSRATTIGLVVGLGMVLLSSRLTSGRALTIAAGVLIVSVGTIGLLAGSVDENFAGRVRVWSLVTEVLQPPLYGFGYGRLTYGTTSYFHAHSVIFQTLADFGAVGLASLGGAVGVTWNAALASRSAHGTTSNTGRAACGVLACIAGLLIAGLADAILSMPLPLMGEVITVVSPIPFVVLAAVTSEPPKRPV